MRVLSPVNFIKPATFFEHNMTSRESLIKNTCSTRTLLFLLIIYVSFLYLFTLTPFRFSKFYFYQYLLFQNGYLNALTGTTSIHDLIINLLMLFPVGFIICSMMRSKNFSFKKILISGIGVGFFISVSIEFLQLFLPRVTSTIDILNNTLSSAIGVAFAYSIHGQRLFDFFDSLNKKVSTYYRYLIFFLISIITMIFMAPVLINDFSNWNTAYPLIFGNERTLDRQWNGNIYKLSIYNRVIDRQQAKILYKNGYRKRNENQIESGLIKDYHFSQGRINAEQNFENFINRKNVADVGGFDTDDNCLVIKNSAIKDVDFGPELIKLIQETNQFSLAIWLKPDNLKMDGPARIVTLSNSPVERNFTLGQMGERINFRVRTPLTGLNGSRVSLLSKPIISSNNVQFIVTTFHRGEAKLYFNGEQQTLVIHSTSQYLPMVFGFEQKRFRVIEIYFVMLFTLGWLGWSLPMLKLKRRIFYSLIIFLPFLLSSAVKFLLVNHAVDVYSIRLSFVVFILVLVSGIFLEMSIVLWRYVETNGKTNH